MQIIFDVTRTVARQFNSTPTGIDRVEFELLRVFLGAENDVEVSYVVTSRFGHAVISNSEMKGIFERLHRLWTQRETTSETSTVHLKKYAFKPFGLSEPTRSLLFLTKKIVSNWIVDHFLQLCKRSRGSVYFSASHVNLNHMNCFEWLGKFGVRAAFFIHDTIPIDFPEFCKRNASVTHKERLKNASLLDSLVMTCSEYSKSRILQNQPFSSPVYVCPLGNEISQTILTPSLEKGKYFVCLGTVEGRKNLTFLLEVWRSIITSSLEETPKLLIVGKRGWNSENVFRLIDDSIQLNKTVEHVDGLSDESIYRLIKGSCGLLAPSLVEGYGLPPTEALQLGVPVIASDIPSHREILGDHALLLDPVDGKAWRKAITSLSSNSHARQIALANASSFRARTWKTFVDDCLTHVICGNNV